MAIQTINIGTIANDGTGDNLRVAFQKVNQNFETLDERFIPSFDAANLGSGTTVFYNKEDGVLYFRSLVAGDNISLSNDTNEITITSDENFTIQTDSNSININGTNKAYGIKGSSNIDTNISGSDITITIDGDGLVALDTSPTLGRALDANSNKITNVGNITANTFTGNLAGTVNGINITESSFNLDFGGIIPNITTNTAYVIATTTLDFGSFTAPASTISDFGSFSS